MKLAPLFFALMLATAVAANPNPSEDAARLMAQRYIQQGFAMAPVARGEAVAGESIRVLVPVTKGLEYIFLVATADLAGDVDLLAFSDSGLPIMEDRRPGRLAGVRFRSSFNGTAVVYVAISRARGESPWCLLVGQRGLARVVTPAPPPQDDGNIFPEP